MAVAALAAESFGGGGFGGGGFGAAAIVSAAAAASVAVSVAASAAASVAADSAAADSAAAAGASAPRRRMQMTRFTFQPSEDSVMKKRIYPFVVVAALLVAGWVGAQGLIMDMLATKVVAKYQTASCEQLLQQKNEPKPQEEQRAVQFLKERSAGSYRLHQQDCRSGGQQVVRMRDDSLIVRKAMSARLGPPGRRLRSDRHLTVDASVALA